MIRLLYLQLQFNLLRLLQQIVITPLYFRYPLLKLDLLFLKHYWSQNPYRICKRYFKDDQLTMPYGDTWPSSIYKLCQVLKLSKDDVLYEVGAGTCRASFWFEAICGCQVVAIEKVPTFIQKAQKIKEKLNSNITLLLKDFLTIDYSKATVIYFYSSSFPTPILQQLIDLWGSLRPKTKVITTSFPLTDFLSEVYDVVGQYQVAYPWGTCRLYIHEKK